MSLPLTGFESRRFPEIRGNISEDLITNLSSDINTSPETVLGVLINIIASSITDVEELSQAVSDNFNVDKAEGKYLDDIVALIGLKRLAESFSTGLVHFRSLNISSTLASGLILADLQGNSYNLSSPVSVSNLSCTNCEVTPIATLGSFQITIAGTTFTSNFGGVVSQSTIVNSLKSQIDTSAPTEYEAIAAGSRLIINKIDKSSGFEVTVNSVLLVTEVEVIGRVSSIENGRVDPEIGSISSIVTGVDGLVSITNYFKLTVGRLQELDEELRIRHSESFQISGSSTPAAIFAQLSNITGVSQVRIFENKSTTTDLDGRPAKSYECIVEGGDSQSVADVVYSTKPAGVETYGDITSIVNDYVGNVESVSWSRPNLVYMNVRVTFSPYDEETFPDDGVTTIKEAVVAAGDSLSLDVDVIPQRLFGPIYNSVSGIGAITVEVGTSVNPASVSPDDIPFQTTAIPISSRGKADFDEIRVTVIQS